MFSYGQLAGALSGYVPAMTHQLRGRYIEFVGASAAGKTEAAIQLALQFERSEFVSWLGDDAQLAHRLPTREGVGHTDVGRRFIDSPSTLRRDVEHLIDAFGPDVLVIDDLDMRVMPSLVAAQSPLSIAQTQRDLGKIARQFGCCVIATRTLRGQRTQMPWQLQQSEADLVVGCARTHEGHDAPIELALLYSSQGMAPAAELAQPRQLAAPRLA
jgi:hypothetical protein